MKLDTPVKLMPGVGPVIAGGLAQLGIITVADLLNHYPRRWEDYSKLVKISALKPGLVSLRARIERVNIKRTARRRMNLTEVVLADDTGTTKAVWFNQPYLAKTFKTGAEYTFRGEFAFSNGHLGFTQPSFEPVNDIKSTGEIIAIYPENKIVNSKKLRQLVKMVLELIDDIPDEMPTSIISQQKLINFDKAIRNLHAPESMKSLALARRRLAFDELFYLIMTGLVVKQELKSLQSPRVAFDLPVVKEILGQLSFELTTAQKAAAWQIMQDIDSDQPMNRMLNGDVGSGKTIVALLAAALCAKSDYQVAFMAPTEILARQHFNSIAKILSPMGIKIDLLVSSMKASEKASTLEAIKNNQTKIVIGTQALLSDKIEFSNLGLVVIDEQHRFGVNQRQILKTKTGHMPHMLSMSATPIPRSLALVVYGELDITTIDQLPPGRKPIKTKIVTNTHRNQVYSQIDTMIGQGRQAYIVCPLIDQSDDSGVKSVTSEFDRLKKSIFAHRRIGLMHGRLSSVEKKTIMDQFKAGELDILVATSVIEVGVDVPNAAVMLIEDGDRFGLAALHQIRGRVGRSSHQSHCYIFTDSNNEETISRLGALENTQDGFRLAQVDLHNRGPGEIYGHRQHGRLPLRIANIYDKELIRQVKQAAKDFIIKEDMLKYPRMVSRINQNKTITSLD